MSELDKRKKLLIAESEVYRQMLKLEIHNFKIYGIQTKRKLNSIRTYASLFSMAFPVMGGLLGKRNPFTRMKRFATLAFLGWQAYSRLGGLFSGARRRASRSQQSFDEADEDVSERSLYE